MASGRVRSVDVQCIATGAEGRKRLVLPSEFGDCWAEYIPLGGDLTLVHSLYRPNRDLVEEAAQTGNGTTLVATFGVSGESAYVARRGDVLGFRAGRATLAAFTASTGERRLRAGTTVRQLRLIFSAGAIARYAGEAVLASLTDREGVQTLGAREISPWCGALLRPLLHSGHLPPLQQQIAALSLASEVLGLLPGAAPSQARAGLDPVCIGKLEQARVLMAERLHEPLTIAYLSLAVGLNEHAFKQGFRTLFGLPPARYLLQLRMQRAWTLLQSGSRVAQAAYAVGYEHPANFSAAFSRHFGRTPKSLGGRDA